MADRDENDRRNDEDEADEELDENDYKTQKDAVLFAIDVSESMRQPPLPPASGSKKADTDSAIAAALKSAYQIMQQRIISSPKDMMGILLFGTDKSKFRDEGGSGGRGGTGYPHCYLYTDLDVPAAEDVKALKSLVEEGEDPDGVLTPATDEEVAMANVLFCANQIFTTNAPNFGSRRLFIITDKDDPHAGDKNAKSAAAVRAKDLYDLGVIIELFPISREDSKFDMTKFYDDIIYRDPAAEAGSAGAVKTSKSGDGLSLLNSLISNINSKQVAKRAYFSNLPLVLAPGLTISVNGYNVLHRQEAARSCYVWLDGERAQLAVGETTKMDAESARTVEKTEVKKAYKSGGEYVYFTPEEQRSLKEYGGKGLRIIGFKPRSSLPAWASVKKSVYLFPSEADYVGSTRVFSALWQKLLGSNKIGIAWYVPRANATPLLVALVPSRLPSDEDSGTAFLPAGIWIYPLPFADDLREVDKKGVAKCSDALIDQMRPIIQNLQLPKATYNPARYPNPALQWHYRILQALALEEEVPEQPDDATMPKFKAIHSRVGGYIDDWSASLAEEAKAARDTRALKREAEEDGDSGRPAKRPKAPSAPAAARRPRSSGGLSTAELKKAVGQGTLGKMTVAEIREILTSKGLSSSGKKADLVDRVEQWIEENA